MLIKYKDIITKEVNNKICYFDDLIDKRFVMDHLDCSESHALKLINAINKDGKNKYKKDYTVFGRGRTSLKWYWNYTNLSGEFI